MRWWKHGDASRLIQQPNNQGWYDFWQQYDSGKLEHDECWPWLGYVNTDGYGSCRVNGRKELAYRAIYTILRGDILSGLELDHLCRNRLCVNPKHLEAVNHRTNVLRGNGAAGTNARKINCPQGHPYSGYDNKGNRICGICLRDRGRRRYNEIHKNR